MMKRDSAKIAFSFAAHFPLFSAAAIGPGALSGIVECL